MASSDEPSLLGNRPPLNTPCIYGVLDLSRPHTARVPESFGVGGGWYWECHPTPSRIRACMPCHLLMRCTACSRSNERPLLFLLAARREKNTPRSGFAIYPYSHRISFSLVGF